MSNVQKAMPTEKFLEIVQYFNNAIHGHNIDDAVAILAFLFGQMVTGLDNKTRDEVFENFAAAAGKASLMVKALGISVAVPEEEFDRRVEAGETVPADLPATDGKVH